MKRWSSFVAQFLVGMCVAIWLEPERDCRNKLGNCPDFGLRSCSHDVYGAWMVENCCEMCTATGFVSGQRNSTQNNRYECKDLLSNCTSYRKDTICTLLEYDFWARTNCAKTCDKCACVDNVDNCALHGTGVCGIAGYKDWVAENCPLTCGHCECVDGVDNCAAYGTSVCTDREFKDWVKENCASFCGFCDCVDKLDNCHDYGTSVCNSTKNKTWVKANCAKFCKTCDKPVGINALWPITLHGCVYKNGFYNQGEKWKDGCNFRCECKDSYSGHYHCENLCTSIQWQLPPQCKLLSQQPGECCDVPSCPDGTILAVPDSLKYV